MGSKWDLRLIVVDRTVWDESRLFRPALDAAHGRRVRGALFGARPPPPVAHLRIMINRLIQNTVDLRTWLTIRFGIGTSRFVDLNSVVLILPGQLQIWQNWHGGQRGGTLTFKSTQYSLRPDGSRVDSR